MKLRKKLVSLFLSLVMLLSVNIGVFGGTSLAAAPDATVSERKIKINDGWRFNLLTPSSITNADSRGLDALTAGIPAGAQDTEPSGAWYSVNLPHDWSIHQNFGTGSARDAQGALPGGTAWYRKTFTTPGDFTDKNVVIQFDSVRMVSQIYVNGTLVGIQHKGDLTFEYDITQYLRPAGSENVIALKVMSGNSSARWYAGAGIHGNVSLFVTNKVHIPVNGVFVHPVVNEKGAGYVIPDFNNPRYRDAAVMAGLKQQSTVNVRSEVTNKTASEAIVSVKSTIFDKTRDVVTDQSSAVAVAAGATVTIDQLIHINNPKLWSVDEPNLYWVKSEVIQNGEVVDTIEATRFGIRYLYLKPGSRTGTADQQLGGFYINGEYIRFNGQCEHRDLGALGMEMYQHASDRRIRKLKDMGVNVFRTAHNPMSEELLEACDRLGMLVCEEITDMWTLQKNGDDYSRWFIRADDATYNSSGAVSGTQVIGTNGTAVGSYLQWFVTDRTPNIVRDAQAMVKRSRNSPAMVLWSTGNEIYDTQHDYGLDVYALIAHAMSEVDSLGVYSNTLFTSSNPGVGDKVSPVAGDPISWRDVIGNAQGSVAGRVRSIREIAYYPNSAYPASQNTVITAEPIIRRARPILSAPPTWDNQGTAANTMIKGTSASRSGMERNMAWADVGGDNYNHGAYNGRKDRNPWMLVGGTETASAFYARGKYSLTSFDSGIGGSRVNSPNDTGSYSSSYPTGWNFVSAPVSVREHRMDVRPFVYGEMNWTGHDYLGEPTPWGNPAKSSSFGIIDTAGFEKDAFYMYRSAWTDIPTVHILPQKWNWTAGTLIPVMVYTNARSVELFVNDVSVRTMNYNRDTANPVYLNFGKYVFAPGSLRAVAYSGPDRTGSIIATDVVYTAGTAQRIELTADRAFMKNDTTDLVYVEAVITDSAGVMMPDAVNRITWTVEGGEIVALDNGDPRDRDRHRPPGSDNINNPRPTTFNRRAFSGKALAIIRPLKGSTQDLVITATAPDGNNTLRSNTVTVGSRNAIGDGSIIFASEKPEVTTGVGIPPVLPPTVGTIYDSGLIEQFRVDSWDLVSVNLNTPGTYTAYGTQLATSERVEAIVHVKAFEAVKDVDITALAGIYPPLPLFITIHYTDGTVGAAPVAWDPIDPSLYAEINTFNVLGRLGPELTLTARVTVKEVVSVEDIMVYTPVGKAPDMPSGVPVLFSDGTTDIYPVNWGLAAADYASAGKRLIFGTLLGSGIKARAFLTAQPVTYLSDLDWVSSSGTVVKDRTVGGNTLGARGVFGGPPTEYQKGLGTLAPAEIVYNIAGLGYDVFSAYFSLSMDDGGMTGRGAVAFEVYNDGKLSFETGEMTRHNEAILANINIAKASQLKIVIKSAGTDGAEFDLGDICDAKFLSNFKGSEVNFDLYGGNIGGDTDDLIQFVNPGARAAAPATSPTRVSYTFIGWNTNRFATTGQTVANVVINEDTTFYAIWQKDAFIDIPVAADAGLKTWQSEKNSNYGSQSNMLIRETNNTGTNGQFGQFFTNTSTSDSTDIKTALVRFDIAQYKDVPYNSVQLRTAYQGSENGTAASNITFAAARADWTTSETSVTWVNWNKTVYIGTGLVVSSNQIAGNSANGTGVNFTVTNLFQAVPAANNTISFAITVGSSTADYRLYSKEGAGTNAALRPTLRLNMTPTPDFTVTYDLNGLNGKAPTQPTLEAGKTFAAAPSLGLLFKEWNTEADGSGTSYKPGDIVTMSGEDLTLYAIWIDDWQAIIASYDSAGALMSVSPFVPDANGYPTKAIVNELVAEGAASVRAYLWSTDFVPLDAVKIVY